jgi:cellobiose-specific phosphotransferase system component IIA
MTTRQNEVRRILQKLNGHLPDDAVVAQMANIAEAAEIHPGDALFPLMVALEYYRVTYEKVPESIKEASAFMLREHAEAHKAQCAKITEEHKGQLEEALKMLLAGSAQWLQKTMPNIIQTELEKAATIAVRDPVKAAAQRFEQATQVAEKATAKLREAENSNVKTWAIAVRVAAIIGGTVSGGVMAWAAGHWPVDLTKEQTQAMQWGTALQEAWPKLSPQVQKSIKDAVSKKEGGN